MDEAPNFDPYIPSPRIDAFRSPVGRPSARDTLLKGMDDLLTRVQDVHETRGEIREASIEATPPVTTLDAPVTTPDATGEADESRNVVYHQDGGEYHVPPSYSEINFPGRRNS